MREEIDTGDKCTNEGHGSTGLQQIANNLTIIKLARTRKKKDSPFISYFLFRSAT